MKPNDLFYKVLIALIPVVLLASAFIYWSCWQHQMSLGAGFWAALGACS